MNKDLSNSREAQMSELSAKEQVEQEIELVLEWLRGKTAMSASNAQTALSRALYLLKNEV